METECGAREALAFQSRSGRFGLKISAKKSDCQKRYGFLHPSETPEGQLIRTGGAGEPRPKTTQKL